MIKKRMIQKIFSGLGVSGFGRVLRQKQGEPLKSFIARQKKEFLK